MNNYSSKKIHAMLLAIAFALQASTLVEGNNKAVKTAWIVYSAKKCPYRAQHEHYKLGKQFYFGTPQEIASITVEDLKFFLSGGCAHAKEIYYYLKNAAGNDREKFKTFYHVFPRFELLAKGGTKLDTISPDEVYAIASFVQWHKNKLTNIPEFKQLTSQNAHCLPMESLGNFIAQKMRAKLMKARVMRHEIGQIGQTFAESRLAEDAILFVGEKKRLTHSKSLEQMENAFRN